MLLEERREIVRRLHISEGHIRAVAAMVESGQPCEKVLHQLGAIRAALAEVSTWLLTCQVEQSREIILHSPRLDEQQEELTRLGDLYRVLTQLPISHGEYPNE